jgi:2',3'-cyclic-nucleotide 2'-phosphodiesterase (5'-nucleotidase family)
MKKLTAFLIAFTLLSATHAMAEGEKVITLKDGTSVKGRVVGLDQGAYVIESETLGQMKIDENKIVSINNPNMPTMAAVAETNPNPAAQQALSNNYQENMSQLQSQIMGNPELMKDIGDLANDPEILQLLSDPALLQAAQDKNAQAMQKNPKTYELMNNPKIKSLINKIEASQQQNHQR